MTTVWTVTYTDGGPRSAPAGIFPNLGHAGHQPECIVTTIWVVNYTDDRFADEIGSRVFSTQAEATAWAEEYVGDQVNVEGDDRYLFAYVEKHDVLDTASAPA